MKRLFGMLIGGLLATLAMGASAVTPLVDVAWVKANLGKPGIVFLDVRGQLAGKSKADYLRGHIPGAIWTNYLKDGWRIKDADGTVGMLPPVAKLEKLIGGLGIDNDAHVVIIPQGAKALDLATATRIYWTFKVLGDDKISILNGGMVAYTKDTDKKTKRPLNPLAKGLVKLPPKTFKANLRKQMIATKADVQRAIRSGIVLVDNRPNNQYLGVNRHPRAKRSGTIPGARNLPENWFTRNGGGTFRDVAALKKLYKLAGVPATGKEITFCNTGHWASLGWFVSNQILGDEQVTMYDGSMVQWSADPSLPMQSAVAVQ